MPEPMDSDFTRAVYVISVAAEIAGVHPQTLRIYERRGLLSPNRTQGGSRRFSEFDLARLRRIQELMDAGCNLEGVKRILELEDEVARLRRLIEQGTGPSNEVLPFGQQTYFTIHRSRRRP